MPYPDPSAEEMLALGRKIVDGLKAILPEDAYKDAEEAYKAFESRVNLLESDEFRNKSLRISNRAIELNESIANEIQDNIYFRTAFEFFKATLYEDVDRSARHIIDARISGFAGAVITQYLAAKEIEAEDNAN